MDEIRAEEFDKMLYPVNRIPDECELFQQFPELTYHKEFIEPIEQFGLFPQSRLFKWIAYTYDIESPFVKRERDLSRRKITVAKYVGYQLNEDRRFEEDVEEMLKGRNETVTRMVIRFCRLLHNLDYSQLVALEEVYYQYLTKMMIGEMKHTEYSTINKMKEDLQALMGNMFAGDKDPRLSEELLSVIDEERLELSPEFIARKLRDGLEPISL